MFTFLGDLMALITRSYFNIFKRSKFPTFKSLLYICSKRYAYTKFMKSKFYIQDMKENKKIKYVKKH